MDTSKINSANNQKYNTPLFISLFLTIIIVITFWQIRYFDFVNYDDPMHVTNNRHVMNGLTYKGIVWAFTSARSIHWIPVTYLTHMLDVEISGLNPGGHHMTNLLLHIANTLLLFFVLKRATGFVWQSAFVSALFAFHTINVEPVAWISDRKGVLGAFFWMLTLWAYIRYAESPGIKRYLIIIIFFILGLMTKPILITLAIILLLFDFWPLKRFHEIPLKRLIYEKLPFFFLSISISIINIVLVQRSINFYTLELFTIKHRVSYFFIFYASYIWRMLWPVNLTIDYPVPSIIPLWQAAGAGILLVFILIVSFRLSSKYPYLIVGFLWFLIILLPMSGLLRVGMQTNSDRYAYISLIGFFIIVSWGVPDLLARLRYKGIVISILSIIILSALISFTWRQLGYWRNSITLFEHALKLTDNVVLYNNMGVTLIKQGKFDKSLGYLFEAIQINPEYASSYNNIGVALIKLGKLKEATKYISEALRLEREFADAYYNMAVILAIQKEYDEANKYYAKALKINPDYSMGQKDLGIILKAVERNITE